VITHLDEAVGRVVDEVDRRKLWDNTYVFFLGDNGFMCGTKGWNGKVVPWEESVRAPVVAAGGKVRRGLRSEALSPRSAGDVARARRRNIGWRAKPAQALHTGRGAPEAGFSVWADGRPEALAVKTAVEPYRLVRTATDKLIVWESGKQALYDIRRDFAEERDLSGDAGSAETMARLRSLLSARMKETGDAATSWLRQTRGGGERNAPARNRSARSPDAQRRR
jgi:arylsulfatase A-like enzyme